MNVTRAFILVAAFLGLILARAPGAAADEEAVILDRVVNVAELPAPGGQAPAGLIIEQPGPPPWPEFQAGGTIPTVDPGAAPDSAGFPPTLDTEFEGLSNGVVDDGCPGGPGQAGAYSEAQFKIGLSDQDPCGNNGWPSDLAGTDNRVTLQDVTSFNVPAPAKFGTSPGQPGFNSRWDLVPGGNPWINMQDLTTLTAGQFGSPAYPPMLAGAKAFGGPPCPWPP